MTCGAVVRTMMGKDLSDVVDEETGSVEAASPVVIERTGSTPFIEAAEEASGDSETLEGIEEVGGSLEEGGAGGGVDVGRAASASGRRLRMADAQ
jgi:hypothetical protein